MGDSSAAFSNSYDPSRPHASSIVTRHKLPVYPGDCLIHLLSVVCSSEDVYTKNRFEMIQSAFALMPQYCLWNLSTPLKYAQPLMQMPEGPQISSRPDSHRYQKIVMGGHTTDDWELHHPQTLHPSPIGSSPTVHFVPQFEMTWWITGEASSRRAPGNCPLAVEGARRYIDRKRAHWV
ncbi:hypothetical protein BC835DRAFT_537193 [Cytidiella melzeri]|nr:hypothetical protein BC835DRAFT_537193 [Cytidiella melzeri]